MYSVQSNLRVVYKDILVHLLSLPDPKRLNITNAEHQDPSSLLIEDCRNLFTKYAYFLSQMRSRKKSDFTLIYHRLLKNLEIYERSRERHLNNL